MPVEGDARTSKAERQDSFVSPLVAAAHELKTPIGIIAGYIDLLVSEKPGPLNEKQREILHDAARNCTRVLQFIRDALASAALQAGAVQMRLETGSLKSCLEEVYETWLPRFESRGVALYVSVGEGLPPLSFDCYKIEHVVSNLLDNALRVSPRGGSVWVAADPAIWDRRSRRDWTGSQERRKRTVTKPNAVKVTVADNGPGIAPEFLQEVFDDFFQTPDSESEGAGLGLSIARQLVQAHSGKIWVESEAGAGSRFFFLLPYGAGAATAAE